jgi:4-amino-4-deoxy-L-arabinose transferase-like glycosyltransferase
MVDGLLALAAAAGVVVGPVAALFALFSSPCGPDSTANTCVLALPHATAVLLPLIAGPLAAVVTLIFAVTLRRRPRARRRAFVAGVLLVVVAAVVPFVIIAFAPDAYPNAYVPR